MKIIDDLIGTLNFNARVKDIRLGVFHTGVLTRYCGLAATLPRHALKQEGPLVKEHRYLDIIREESGKRTMLICAYSPFITIRSSISSSQPKKSP